MHQKVCDLNVMAAVSAIAGIATFSGAADDGAATLVPRSFRQTCYAMETCYAFCSRSSLILRLVYSVHKSKKLEALAIKCNKSVSIPLYKLLTL